MNLRFLCFRRAAAVALVVLMAAACMEVQVHVRVQADGSATMRLNYVVAQKLINGEYVEFEHNDLLPLDRAAIDRWVASIPGARLVSATIDTIDDAEYQKYGGLQRINFQVMLSDIEAVRFDHIRFAFYPWRSRRIFQFVVDKNTKVPEPEGRVLVGDVPGLLKGALAGRALTLIVELPNRITDSNAVSTEWSTAQWRIPLQQFLDTDSARIVAWAATDARGTFDSWVKPLQYWAGGEGWRSPVNLPDKLYVDTATP